MSPFSSQPCNMTPALWLAWCARGTRRSVPTVTSRIVYHSSESLMYEPHRTPLHGVTPRNPALQSFFSFRFFARVPDNRSPDIPAFGGAEVPINDYITAPRVLVISNTGDNLGEMPIHAALTLARQESLDLVQVANSGPIPVCKLQDYRKEKVTKQKALSVQKKLGNVTQTKTKELRLGDSISPHDLTVKCAKAAEMLAKGVRVVFVVDYNSQSVNIEKGRDVSRRVSDAIATVGVLDGEPQLVRRRLLINCKPLSKGAGIKIKSTPTTATTATSP